MSNVFRRFVRDLSEDVLFGTNVRKANNLTSTIGEVNLSAAANNSLTRKV